MENIRRKKDFDEDGYRSRISKGSKTLNPNSVRENEYLKSLNERRGVLEALLYFSGQGENSFFSTDEGDIWREVLGGSYECLTGRKCPHIEFGINARKFINEFISEKVLNDECRLHHGIKDSLYKLLIPYESYSKKGEKSVESELFYHVNGPNGIFTYDSSKNWKKSELKEESLTSPIPFSFSSLPRKTISHVRDDVLPFFSREVVKDLFFLARFVRGYINEDLRKNYDGYSELKKRNLF